MAEKTWVRITHCQNIPLRQGRAVMAGNREVAIFNLGDRFLAIDNQCPHKGGPLADGIVSGATVVCPLHTWKLDLETGKGVSAASASRCVETFRTRVDQDVIWIELPAKSLVNEEVPAVCMEHSGLVPWDESDSAASN